MASHCDLVVHFSNDSWASFIDLLCIFYFLLEKVYSEELIPSQVDELQIISSYVQIIFTLLIFFSL